MKRKIFYIMIIAVLVTFGLIWINSNIFAQETPSTTPEKEIPFIDRDGDGVNDLLQGGWGLRLMMRHRNLDKLIDTDNDGVPDTPLREYLKTKMDEKMNLLVDTDNNGVPDTPINELIRKQYRTFDRNGDGIPDIATPEEIRKHLEEMKQWRQLVQGRIKQGLPPFIDENGDGIPDNMPAWMRMWGKFNNDKKDK